MDAKTLKALEGSIEKWRLIRYEGGVDNGPNNCPLCKLFYYSPSLQCTGCPVKTRTGYGVCEKTPYSSWAEHTWAIHGDVGPSGVKCPTCRGIATREINFLKSLLP